jgi:hypothetical protein
MKGRRLSYMGNGCAVAGACQHASTLTLTRHVDIFSRRKLDRQIALALKSELKDRNPRAKLVAGWTGASERTVKNWILGRYAPCGRHLVVLAQHSDQVLNAILSMADRRDLLLAPKVEDLRRKVFELAAIMGEPHAYDPDT